MCKKCDKEKTWERGYRALVICPHCDDYIWSTYIGQFASCRCGACFVDETLFYMRWGGPFSARQEEKILIYDKEL